MSPLPRNQQLKLAIIGCGLIGHKRANAIRGSGLLLYACDIDIDRAASVAETQPGCVAITDFRIALADPAVGAVIIATVNAALSPIMLTAARAGKHVLVEKPGALRAAALREVADAAFRTGAKVRLGYNHRFHPAMQKAKALIDSGIIGPLMFLRGRYGHGGRKGYDREWRADATQSGGGELIDQGVHLIDLAGWFLGEFTAVAGHAATYYWDMKVDDNAFLSLRTATGQTAWLHVSCTEWKNLFSFEIYGRNAKLAIDGLGGSYGVERLSFYRMLPEMGPPETTIFEFPRGDDSWTLETKAFVDDILHDGSPEPSLAEGIRVLEIVEQIYRDSGYPHVSEV